jgi:hypothetical protein
MEGKKTCGMSSEVSFGFKVRITRTIAIMQSSRIGNMFSSSRLAHHSLVSVVADKEVIVLKVWYILVKYHSFKELKFTEI